jgi:enoyl-CoA hydratase/carnithine racemase
VATNAGTLLLPEVLGETAARELLLTGELRDCAWAHQHGFLTETCTAAHFEERTAELAAAFEGTSRAAVAATKAMLNARLGDLVEAAMEREERWCVELFEEPDARAALAAFAAR